MNDSRASRSLECGGELATDFEHSGRGQSFVAGDFMQRAAFDVLHRQKDGSGVFANFINRPDVRMSQALKHASFEVQSIAPPDIVSGIRR